MQQRLATVDLNTWQYAQLDTGSALPLLLLAGLAKAVATDDATNRGKLSRSINALAQLKSLQLNLAGVGLGYEKGDAKKEEEPDILGMKKTFELAVVEHLAGKGCERLVIFIDDLDRVRPERAVEILEVLKNFVDIEHTVFVIACDYKVVIKGLQAKFGVSEGELDGRSFFDKIIQVPFRMPVHQYDVEKFVRKMLEGIQWPVSTAFIGDYKFFLEKSIGFNPRSIKRLCNTLLLLSLVSKGEKANKLLNDQLGATTLFAVVCLEAACETLHAELASRVDDLDDLQTLLDHKGTNAEVEDRIDSETRAQVRDVRKLERGLELLSHLGTILFGDTDENKKEHSHGLIRAALQMSAVTSTTESQHSSAKSWDENELQRSFEKQENRVAERLLAFARKHSHDGRVTGGAKTKNAAVKFYVGREVGQKTIIRQLFSCNNTWVLLYPQGCVKLVGEDPVQRFRQRLAEGFGTDVDAKTTEPRIRMEAFSPEQTLSTERLEAFQNAVLEIVNAPSQTPLS